MKNKIDNYCINLMWINSRRDEKDQYVCSGKSREDMGYVLTQLKKWCVANPEADVNFWFDSECTNKEATENTKTLLKQISDRVHLRDIREMPFVQCNSELFLSSIPIYFRIDFLKLIICLHLMENEAMESVIYTDMSIGDKVEKVLSKNELFNRDALKNLNQFGMLIGQDTIKPENQFLQTLNTPELVQSMTHAINCCLYLATNALNLAIREQNPSRINNLYYAPFTATMVHIYLYLLVLQSKEPVHIRADVVKEGNKDNWVVYNPEKHGYIMFGNRLKPFDLGSGYIQSEKGIVEFISLVNIVKLPESLKLRPNINEICSFEDSIVEHVVRKDLNPGKMGSSHGWDGAIPLPRQGKEFHYSYWPKIKIEGEHSLKHGCLLKDAPPTKEIISEEKLISFWSYHMSYNDLGARLIILIDEQDMDETERELEAKVIIDIMKEMPESIIKDSSLVDIHWADTSILERAIKNNRINIVKLLIGARQHPDLRNASGQTPLFYAVHKTNPELTKLLLDAGANPYMVDTWGLKSPLDYAMQALNDKNNSNKDKGSLEQIGLLLTHLANEAAFENPILFFNLLKKWENKYDPNLLICLNKLCEELRHRKYRAMPALLKQTEEYFQELQEKVSVHRSLVQADLVNVGLCAVAAEIIAEYDIPSFDLSSTVFFKPAPKLNHFDRAVQPSLEEKPNDQQAEAKLQIKCASVCSMM